MHIANTDSHNNYLFKYYKAVNNGSMRFPPIIKSSIWEALILSTDEN